MRALWVDEVDPSTGAAVVDPTTGSVSRELLRDPQRVVEGMHASGSGMNTAGSMDTIADTTF